MENSFFKMKNKKGIKIEIQKYNIETLNEYMPYFKFFI